MEERPKEAQPVQSRESSLVVADSNKTAWEIAQSSLPRDPKRIWDEIKSELEFAPEAADNCWYSIPYKNNKTGKIEPVEGIGTHGSQTIVRAWGHNASGGGIREEFSDRVICRGIFYDHMKNTQVYREVIVHRFQQSEKGTTYRLVGKHWDNAIQSGISKAKRNAQLEGLPEFLKDRFFDLVKKLANAPKQGQQKLTAPVEIQKAGEFFIKKYKISKEMFDRYISELDQDESEIVVHLRGLRAALYNGETTAIVVFGDRAEEGVGTIQPPQEKEAPSETPGKS